MRKTQAYQREVRLAQHARGGHEMNVRILKSLERKNVNQVSFAYQREVRLAQHARDGHEQAGAHGVNVEGDGAVVVEQGTLVGGAQRKRLRGVGGGGGGGYTVRQRIWHGV